ncbi:MAG: EVE domain-containing protein [Candidatus Zambryskibacteria bacterium]|nr:EVE domain-containing protein [Candidatus Zambryskibacteria bacterium]
MRYWLIKSEPDCYSIADLKQDKKTSWTGVRNYQARNFIKTMSQGDLVLFYHSGANPPAVAGICKVASSPYGDATALDSKNEHFDPKASKENPIWSAVDMQYVSTLKEPVTLPQIKINPKLSDMLVAQQGNRLSIMPVSEKHFKLVSGL